MLQILPARLALALALSAATASQASAHDWWDTAFGWLGPRCNGSTACYGPPYGNDEPPERYVYDHRVGPTWTGNGWAYLPVGRYRPRPPQYTEPPPPPPSADRDDDHDAEAEDGVRPMK